jgi:hypothetical protein
MEPRGAVARKTLGTTDLDEQRHCPGSSSAEILFIRICRPNRTNMKRLSYIKQQVSFQNLTRQHTSTSVRQPPVRIPPFGYPEQCEQYVSQCVKGDNYKLGEPMKMIVFWDVGP